MATSSTRIRQVSLCSRSATLHAVAAVSGPGPTPTGSVTFELFGNGTCDGTPASTEPGVALAEGSAESASTVGLTPGDYSFQARYSGDSEYAPSDGECAPFKVDEPNEQSTTDTTIAVPTTAAPTTTTLPPDDDGVPAGVENGAPNGGDGNGDGIPDAEQANVASLPSAYDVDGNDALDDYVTIESPLFTSLANVQALRVPSDNPPPDGASIPSGLFDYDVRVAAPGDRPT